MTHSLGSQPAGATSSVAHRDDFGTWLRVVVGASFAFLVVGWLARPWTAGDTPFVLDGTSALLDCLGRGDFVGCRESAELDYWGLTTPIGDWPPLQYLVDLASIGLGLETHNDRELVLSLLSVAGVVGSMALAFTVLSHTGQRPWFWGFLLVVMTSPLIAYARSTSGEALATGLLVALVAAAVLRAPPLLIALAALAAALTKETSYPFVAVLGLLGLLLAAQRTGLPVRRHVIWGAVGLAAAFVLASAFNVIRFGSILNENYLEPELHTPGVGRKLEYVLAALVSPSGGMLFFWPAASLVLAAACVAPFFGPSDQKLDRRPALLLAAVSVVLLFGFASWWTPFGWFAYGPRLMLPWVLPLVLLALVAYGQRIGELAGRLLAPLWRTLLVFAVVLALALPHVGYLWQPSSIGGFFAHPECDAPWRMGVEEFHACQHEQIWFGQPKPLYAIDGVATTGGALTGVVVAAGLLACLLLLRAELPARRRAGSSMRTGRPPPEA